MQRLVATIRTLIAFTLAERPNDIAPRPAHCIASATRTQTARAMKRKLSTTRALGPLAFALSHFC